MFCACWGGIDKANERKTLFCLLFLSQELFFADGRLLCEEMAEKRCSVTASTISGTFVLTKQRLRGSEIASTPSSHAGLGFRKMSERKLRVTTRAVALHLALRRPLS